MPRKRWVRERKPREENPIWRMREGIKVGIRTGERGKKLGAAEEEDCEKD